MMVIAVTNQKGGAGKSSAAVNISYELALTGRRVLLVDIDPQANASKVLSAGEYSHDLSTAELLSKSPPPLESMIKSSPHHENLFYIPSSLRLMQTLDMMMARPYRESILKKALQRVKGFDTVIIDTQPNAQIGTVNAMVAADHFLIPVDGGFSLDGLADLLMLIDEFRAGDSYTKHIFKSKHSAAKKVMGRFIDDSLAPYADDVLQETIRIDEAVEQANTSAAPVRLYRRASRAAMDYQQLTKELLRRLA